MSWSFAPKLKNGLVFADPSCLPASYSGYSESYSEYQLYGYYGSSEEDHARYRAASGELQRICQIKDIYNIANLNSGTYLFRCTNGAIELVFTKTVNPSNPSLYSGKITINIIDTTYTRRFAGSYSYGMTRDTQYWTDIFLTLIVNNDTKQARIATTTCETADYGEKAYYTSAGVYLRIFDSKYAGSTNISPEELYKVVSDDIIDPGGGSDNPYGDDTYDEPIGGDGEHDDESDEIEQSPIQIAQATRSGMCTAFVPNWGEIQNVADALLDPHWFQLLESNIVKLSDVIIGLSVFPCTVPATNVGSVTANWIGINISTGVTSHIADKQIIEVDCGELEVKEYWGNCLDYNPYTKISIFLPFCGTYELDTDEIMGKTIGVSYRIDIFSGACLATIKIDGSVYYQYSGECSSQIPLTSVSFDSFLSSLMDLGIATATGSAAIGAAGAAVSSAESDLKARQASGKKTKRAANRLASEQENYAEVVTESRNSTAETAASAVMNSKGFYTHSGAIGGSPGLMGVKTPFLIFRRPEQVIPGDYGKFHGFPCNTSAKLGDLVGYTKVDDIRLNIPDATVDEILECEQLLKGGIVI